MNDYEQLVHDLVRSELTSDMKPESFRNDYNYYRGHCHHASLAMYNILGGKETGYKLQRALDDEGVIHYWLVDVNGGIIDPTVEQYTNYGKKPPYLNLKNNSASYRKTKATIALIGRVSEKLKLNEE